MGKRTITKWWIWGAVLEAVGGSVATMVSIVMSAHIGDMTAGFQTRFVPDDYYWTTVGVAAQAGMIAGVGVMFQLVAWIGAVFNTNRLANNTAHHSADKSANNTWYHVLLWGGVLGYFVGLLTFSTTIGRWGLSGIVWPGYLLGGLIGWAVMLPYLVAGPDGMAQHEQPVHQVHKVRRVQQGRQLRTASSAAVPTTHATTRP